MAEPMTPERLADIRADLRDRDGWDPAHELVAEVDRLQAQVAAVEKFAQEQARPFADGVPDREGQYVCAGIRAALGG